MMRSDKNNGNGGLIDRNMGTIFMKNSLLSVDLLTYTLGA